MKTLDVNGRQGLRLRIMGVSDDSSSFAPDHIVILAYGKGYPRPIVFELRTKEAYLKLQSALRDVACAIGWEPKE